VANRLWAIALNTFRENRRDRILYVLLLFAVLMILAGVGASELSPYEQGKILLDLGQGTMFLVGSLVAILLGIGLVSKEIERRTVYVMISKPVGRGEFLVGKVLGLTLTLTAAVGLMSLILLGVTSAYGTPPTWALIQALVLLWCQLVLLVCMAVAFSAFVSSTTLAAMFSLSVWILGQITQDLAVMAGRSKSAVVKPLLLAVYWILPDLTMLDAKSPAAYGIAVPAGQFAWSIGYAFAYSAMLLALATLVFSRRDFR
jgi:Cu-processing system permease protein